MGSFDDVTISYGPMLCIFEGQSIQVQFIVGFDALLKGFAGKHFDA